MASSKSVRVRSELADIVFRGCRALGVIVGLWWAIGHQTNAACSRPRGIPNEVDRCTSHGMGTLIAQWGVALGGGMLLGATVGLLLARRIRPTPPRRSVRTQLTRIR